MPTELLTAPPSETPQSGDWQRLRALLLGRERAALESLTGKVGDRDSLARSVAGILAEALELRSRQDASMTRVLAPLVEDSLQQSVRNNPKPLIEALYPIMGSTIRRSLSEALAELLQAFNGAVEQSLSLRALKWRWDAWRTGQPYASVVLLHTLVYRVEQIFLIHRDSGLLLHHVLADRVVSQDPDMIAGMLTAIRDFVSDSFQVSQEEGVSAVRLGDLTIQVRVGPKAVLAAVVRGNAPGSLSLRLTETLEQVHASYGAALAGFAGDAAPFDDAGILLAPCLSAQTRSVNPRPRWRGYAMLTLLAAALAAWGMQHHRTTRDWDQAVADLGAEPGFVLLDAGAGGSHRLRGLRDPLSRDPAQVLGAERLQRLRIQLEFKPYLSLEPAFVLARAERLLRPPAGVRFALQDGVLHAKGTASLAWLHEAAGRAPLIEGIRAWDASAVTPDDAAGFEQARRALSAVTVYFPIGSAALPVTERTILETLDPLLARFRDAAEVLHLDYGVEVIGRADAPGTTALNLLLSQNRANAVRAFLVAHGLPAERVLARGIGASDATGLERRVNISIFVKAP
jgi:OOP family OmpA-OmpF porin